MSMNYFNSRLPRICNEINTNVAASGDLEHILRYFQGFFIRDDSEKILSAFQIITLTILYVIVVGGRLLLLNNCRRLSCVDNFRGLLL